MNRRLENDRASAKASPAKSNTVLKGRGSRPVHCAVRIGSHRFPFLAQFLVAEA